MWAKASISPLFERAREAREAEPVGAADRPHIHRPFLPTVPRRDQGFWVMVRGELAIRGGTLNSAASNPEILADERLVILLARLQRSDRRRERRPAGRPKKEFWT
jgi:hypothetical protein